MQDKDFAHLQTASFEQKKASPTSSQGLLITGLAMVFAIICFTIGFFMGEKHGIQSSESNKQVDLIGKIQKQKQQLALLKEDAKKWQQQEANTSQIGELTFYNELPEQSVIPEPIEPNASTQRNAANAKGNSAFLDKLEADLTANISDQNKARESASQKLEDIINQQLNKSARSYRIQVASLRNEQDAIKVIAQLRDIGLSAEIQRVSLADRGIYFRIYTHNFNTQQDAIRAQDKIREKLRLNGLLIQNG